MIKILKTWVEYMMKLGVMELMIKKIVCLMELLKDKHKEHDL